MSLLDIARVYIDLVKLEEAIPEEESHAKEEACILRSKYHQILMDKMREENVDFFDRFDATRMAYDLVKGESI